MRFPSGVQRGESSFKLEKLSRVEDPRARSINQISRWVVDVLTIAANRPSGERMGSDPTASEGSSLTALPERSNHRSMPPFASLVAVWYATTPAGDTPTAARIAGLATRPI